MFSFHDWCSFNSPCSLVLPHGLLEHVGILDIAGRACRKIVSHWRGMSRCMDVDNGMGMLCIARYRRWWLCVPADVHRSIGSKSVTCLLALSRVATHAWFGDSSTQCVVGVLCWIAVLSDSELKDRRIARCGFVAWGHRFQLRETPGLV